MRQPELHVLDTIIKKGNIVDYCFKLLFLVFVFGYSLIIKAESLKINQNFSVSSGANKYNFSYVGGVRVIDGKFGSSRIGHTKGTFAVADDGKSFWVTGHWGHFSIARYSLKELSNGTSIDKLPVARNLDPFVKICPDVSNENKPNIVTGIEYVDSKLFVNVAKAYDAAGKNQSTTMVFDEPLNLSRSNQYCYFSMEGKAHSAGWMSKIPSQYQDAFGAMYLTGYASNIPINSRLSIGPTLFTWFPYFISPPKAMNETLSTTKLIDYSLAEPLMEDRYNKSGSNALWTELSQAYYGQVMPQTGEYLIFGISGGHHSKIGYKITQNNGAVCPGPCAFDHKDYYNFFWFYNPLNSYDKRKPTSWGKFNLLKGDGEYAHLIGGADYSGGKMYFLVRNADTIQSKYEKMPVILVYNVSIARHD